jgi:hypothetical protein
MGSLIAEVNYDLQVQNRRRRNIKSLININSHC